MKNKSIGGYFELELNRLNEVYHSNAIALNTGRNALEYILLSKTINTLYLPYFTCDALLEPLRKLKLNYHFYFIDENLEPVFDFSVLTKDDAFLYTNYFGLKDSYVRKISNLYDQLIVDNSQAFFSKPYNNEPTFYSPRKFFGIPDGGYLYITDKLDDNFDIDISHDRMSHLLLRRDISAEFGYSSFVSNDILLSHKPIKMMSDITSDILKSIDYKLVSKKRIENFQFLDNILNSCNNLKLPLDSTSVPLVYPFWSNDGELRKRLFAHNIYCPVYWPNINEWCQRDSLEFQLANEVVYLPIDQRYDVKDMEKIIKIVNYEYFR